MSRNTKYDVAILGAGLAGCAAAHALSERGLKVALIEKSRGPGGRTSTRRTDSSTWHSHGLSHFAASHPVFSLALEKATEAGVLMRKPLVRFDTMRHSLAEDAVFLGVNGSNALCKNLAQGAAHFYSHTVTSMREWGYCWKVTFDGLPHIFADNCILTFPYTQTRELLNHSFASLESPFSFEFSSDDLSAFLNRKPPDFWPLWVALFTTTADLFQDIDQVNFPQTEWVEDWTQNDLPLPIAKLRRTGCGAGSPQHAWVLETPKNWSSLHLEDPSPLVTEILTKSFALCTGVAVETITSATVHRWRYAQTGGWDLEAPLQIVFTKKERCDNQSVCKMILAADWVGDGTAQSAFLMGTMAAAQCYP